MKGFSLKTLIWKWSKYRELNKHGQHLVGSGGCVWVIKLCFGFSSNYMNAGDQLHVELCLFYLNKLLTVTRTFTQFSFNMTLKFPFSLKSLTIIFNKIIFQVLFPSYYHYYYSCLMCSPTPTFWRSHSS